MTHHVCGEVANYGSGSRDDATETNERIDKCAYVDPNDESTNASESKQGDHTDGGAIMSTRTDLEHNSSETSIDFD
jgi:hypothetical protein